MDSRKTKLNIALILIIVCLALFIIIMISRSSSGNTPVSEVKEAVSSLAGINELQEKDDTAAARSFGFVPSEYIYYKSNNIMDVRELFIAKASDYDEMEQIKSSVRSRLDIQIENFTGYGTNQLDMLENAVTVEKGDYYFYAVGDEAGEWQSAFLKAAG